MRLVQLVIAAIALSAIATGFKYVRQDARDTESASRSAGPAMPISGGAEPAMDAAVEAETPIEATIDEAPKPLGPDEIMQLVADTASGDARRRATAIVALVNAPKSDAIAALRRVVEGGEPTVDRPLALRSLRDLALHQGDEDGAIRDVVRETIYHGDDDTLIEHAQLALEMIEESEMSR